MALGLEDRGRPAGDGPWYKDWRPGPAILPFNLFGAEMTACTDGCVLAAGFLPCCAMSRQCHGGIPADSSASHPWVSAPVGMLVSAASPLPGPRPTKALAATGRQGSVASGLGLSRAAEGPLLHLGLDSRGCLRRPSAPELRQCPRPD